MNGENVLAELRLWRDEFARSHRYDVGAMAAVLRDLDGRVGERLIRGEPRRPTSLPPGGGEGDGEGRPTRLQAQPED